jgi:hypothetical protein
MKPPATTRAAARREQSPDRARSAVDLPLDPDDAGTLTRHAPPARPHVVVLDLDGVLRHWEPAIVGGAAADPHLPEDAVTSPR